MAVTAHGGKQETGLTNVFFDDVGKSGKIIGWEFSIPQMVQAIENPRKTGRWSFMNILLAPLQVPLYLDDRGSLRVTGTRVQLERIVNAWKNNERPEGIVESYENLDLQAVYAILAWYLQFREEVDAYLLQSDVEAEAFLATMKGLQTEGGSLIGRILAENQGVANAAHAEG